MFKIKELNYLLIFQDASMFSWSTNLEGFDFFGDKNYDDMVKYIMIKMEISIKKVLKREHNDFYSKQSIYRNYRHLSIISKRFKQFFHDLVFKKKPYRLSSSFKDYKNEGWL